MVIHHCDLADAGALRRDPSDATTQRSRLVLPRGYVSHWYPPVVIHPVRHNDFAVIGATLGSISLFISMLPVIGMFSWVLAPLGLASSVVGLCVGIIRRAGRAGALWGISASIASLALCLGWVLLVRML